MRFLFALVIHDSVSWSRTFSALPKPNGLAKLGWEPLNQALLFFGHKETLDVIRHAIWVPLAIYVAGIIPIPAIVSLLVVTVATGTLENSDGGIGHSYQIVSLILLAQLGSHILTTVGERRTGPSPWLKPGLAAQNHATHLAKVTIAAAYVVCGVSKLIKSDFLWVMNSPLLSVQMTKANWREYYNTLELKDDFVTTRLPQLIVEYPNFARLFFGAGLALELGTLLALRGRRWALAVGLSLVLFHSMLDWVMSLTFWTHMFCIVVFFVNVPGIRESLREGKDGTTDL